MNINILLPVLFLSSCTLFQEDFSRFYLDELVSSPNDAGKSLILSQSKNHAEVDDLKTFLLGKEIFKIRKVVPKVTGSGDPQKLIDSKIMMVSSLFESQVVPYQGVVTQSSSCLSKNTKTPTFSENVKQKKYVFSLMANENFVFGTCIEEQDIYEASYIILFCKKNNVLFEIKHFAPKSTPKTNIDFNCT